MAILDLEGFDYYSLTADFALRGWSGSLGGSTTGRSGSGSAARIGGTGRTRSLPGGNQAIVAVGFGFREATALAAGNRIVQTLDAGTVQVDLRESDTIGNVQVTRNGTVLATTTTTPLILNTWQHIVFAATIHPTTGTYDVWINGVNVLTATGQNTRASANSYANTLGLAMANAGGGHDYDDLWIGDTLTNEGDLRVETLYPSGNGNNSQMLGSDGNSTDNYLLVDETLQNGDTDYVGTATAAQKDTYAMANLPTVPTAIKATAQRVVIRKDDAGARTGRTVIRSGATDYEGGDFAVSDTYTVMSTIRLVDPATSAAWTETNVNAIEAGQKLQA